jgi:hypothetical protein
MGECPSGAEWGWRTHELQNAWDELTVVLFCGLCKQLLDILPILIGAYLPGGVFSVGGGRRRVGHLET